MLSQILYDKTEDVGKTYALTSYSSELPQCGSNYLFLLIFSWTLFSVWWRILFILYL